MYNTMYKKFRKKGIIRNIIFKAWYNMENIRCNGLDIFYDYIAINKK